jgi:hypothetical protein
MMAMTWYCLNMRCRIFPHSYDSDAARNKITIIKLNVSKDVLVDYEMRFKQESVTMKKVQGKSDIAYEQKKEPTRWGRTAYDSQC